MQTLVAQIANTFVGDAAALVNGFGRIVTHIVMAPIERISNACDVAGVLPGRRSPVRVARARAGRGGRGARGAPKSRRSVRCGRLFGRLSPFRSLNQLT
jgi:hypothetical protein